MQIPPSATCIAPMTGTFDHNDWDSLEPVRCGRFAIGVVKAPVPGGMLVGKTCARHFEIVHQIVLAEAFRQNGGAGRLPGALPPARPHNHLAAASTRQ